MAESAPTSLWHFTGKFLEGMMSVLTITSPPLYRYPYRNSAEAFRGDFKRVAEDIAAAFDALEGK